MPLVTCLRWQMPSEIGLFKQPLITSQDTDRAAENNLSKHPLITCLGRQMNAEIGYLNGP